MTRKEKREIRKKILQYQMQLHKLSFSISEDAEKQLDIIEDKIHDLGESYHLLCR